MSQRLSKVADNLKVSLSDFSRNALQQAIDVVERELLRQELKEGFEANYQYYLDQQEDWKYADSEERSSETALTR